MLKKLVNIQIIFWLAMLPLANCKTTNKAQIAYFEKDGMLCEDKPNFEMRCEDAFKVCWYKATEQNTFFVTCRQKPNFLK